MHDQGMTTKPNVYDFHDFKTYFSAYLEWLKAQDAKYSLRWVAKRLDLKSHAYLLRIADGTKVPTDEFLIKLALLVELNVEEIHFLKLLTSAQNAKTIDQREFFLKKVDDLRQENPTITLTSTTFDLIHDWHLVAILALSMIDGFVGEPEWVAGRLNYAITFDTARLALEKLEAIQLFKRDADGRLVRNVESLLTQHNIPSHSIRSFHRQMLTFAETTLDGVDPSRRTFFSHTFGFNPSRMADAESLIVEFRRRFQTMLTQGDETEVYHLAIQFFPLTVISSDPKKE